MERYRSRGVQTRLTHRRLEYAKIHGYDIAMVQATPGSVSERNIASAEFRLVHKKLFVQ